MQGVSQLKQTGGPQENLFAQGAWTQGVSVLTQVGEEVTLLLHGRKLALVRIPAAVQRVSVFGADSC